MGRGNRTGSNRTRNNLTGSSQIGNGEVGAASSRSQPKSSTKTQITSRESSIKSEENLGFPFSTTREETFLKSENHPLLTPADDYLLKEFKGSLVDPGKGKQPWIKIGDNGNVDKGDGSVIKNSILTSIVETDKEIRLITLDVGKKGSGLGSEVVNKLCKYSDTTGKPLVVKMITNYGFFNTERFPSFKKTAGNEITYSR